MEDVGILEVSLSLSLNLLKLDSLPSSSFYVVLLYSTAKEEYAGTIRETAVAMVKYLSTTQEEVEGEEEEIGDPPPRFFVSFLLQPGEEKNFTFFQVFSRVNFSLRFFFSSSSSVTLKAFPNKGGGEKSHHYPRCGREREREREREEKLSFFTTGGKKKIFHVRKEQEKNYSSSLGCN